MAIISMAVYCTEENKKDEYLRETLLSLQDTVDYHTHRVILSLNGKTKRTDGILDMYSHVIHKIIYNDRNLGTAEAINKAWKLREPGESCIKMDDDVVIHQSGWVELMEEAIKREPQIGIIGLKRKDCIEKVDHPDEYFRSKLWQLPQVPGEKWITV